MRSCSKPYRWVISHLCSTFTSQVGSSTCIRGERAYCRILIVVLHKLKQMLCMKVHQLIWDRDMAISCWCSCKQWLIPLISRYCLWSLSAVWYYISGWSRWWCCTYTSDHPSWATRFVCSYIKCSCHWSWSYMVCPYGCGVMFSHLVMESHSQYSSQCSWYWSA